MRRFATLLVVCALALAATAQQPAPAADPGLKVSHIIGFENLKNGAKGTLVIEGEFLKFKSTAGGSSQLAVGSIDNITTGDDSRRLVGGAIGFISMFAPYGSGRFLSLFRKQIDVITIEYHDANGGKHGAIFALPNDAAAPLKAKLVAAGAHALPVPEPPAASSANQEKK
jgi:hypothetical protein